MSRESLLDEAIIKAKECEDWQLVEWLRMARGGESAARWYSDKLREAHRTERKLLDENAKLVMKLNAEHLVRQNVERENAKLRELVWDLYCLAYPSAVEWEVSDETYDKYSPCEKCEELHGGKSPCASTAKDMTEECCAPIQANVVAEHMRELGVSDHD